MSQLHDVELDILDAQIRFCSQRGWYAVTEMWEGVRERYLKERSAGLEYERC